MREHCFTNSDRRERIGSQVSRLYTDKDLEQILFKPNSCIQKF